MNWMYAELEEAVPGLVGGPVRLRRVVDLERQVDARALLADASVSEPPYWAHLWPAARALAKLVAETGGRMAARRVIELGCGLGLPSLAAARCGASIVLTDRNRDALGFAAASLADNGLVGMVAAMDIRFPAVRGRFDLCLAADVTYDPATNGALVEFLLDHLAQHGEAWVAESVRAEEGALPERLRREFDVAERRMAEVEDGHRVWVRVLQVRRRS